MRTFIGTIARTPTGMGVIGPSFSRSEEIELAGMFGRLTRNDDGKRVFRVNGVMQVENDEQRNARCAPTVTLKPERSHVNADSDGRKAQSTFHA